MKKLEVGDLIKGTGCNADILKAVVTREPWEEIDIECVELKIIDSTNPATIDMTFSVCTSYVEKINADDNSSGKPKFKVRDHVKGINDKYGVTNKNLIDAEVLEIGAGTKIEIKCIRFLDGDPEFVGDTFYVDPDDFDYAEGYSPVSRLVSSYMINGKEYTDEQYVKDCERFGKAFPHDKTIEIQHAIENVLIVYQWAQQNPMVTNLDHYAEEFGWSEDRKKGIADSICPFCRMGGSCPRRTACEKCRKWWLQEYQPKGAKCTTQ